MNENNSDKLSLPQALDLIKDNNAYLNGFIQLERAYKNISEIFISEQSFYPWALEVEKNYIEINSAYNRAKLLIDNVPMLNYLKETTILFSDFYLSIANYAKSGQATNIIENAWNNFLFLHPVFKRRVNGYHKSAVSKTPIKKVKYDTVHKKIQRTGNFIV